MSKGTTVLDREVEVVHGANVASVRLQPGTVVATLRMQLCTKLGIPTGAPAYVYGGQIADEAVIPPGAQKLEFVQRVGEKG